MKISIAMATYNGAQYLQEQLNSFLRQTRLPDELVVVDDCSTDATMEILSGFAAIAPFAMVVARNDYNLGVIKNFEKALTICVGDVIFLSDQDDVWLPEKIATQSQFLEQNQDCAIVLCDAAICYKDMTLSGRTKLMNLRDIGIRSDNYVQGCCMAVRRDFLLATLPMPILEINHDGWIGYLARVFHRHSVIKDILQLYRRHDTNVSQSLDSRASRVSQVDVINEYGLRNAEHGWLEGIHIVEVAKDHVLKRRDVFLGFCPTPGGLDDVVQDMSLSIEKTQQRIEIVRKIRMIRWIFIARFFAQGGYSQFSGWKSAVKDLIRP